MMKMVSFDDAQEKLRNAEGFLRNSNFADAILNTQMSVELSVKCLFDALDIKFEKKHDIPDECYKEVFERLQHLLGKDYYVANDVSTKIGKARILSASLSAMRNYTEYGMFKISAKEMFGRSSRMENLARAFCDCANEVFWELSNLAMYLRELK
jgi:HEPN domain-containing protein